MTAIRPALDALCAGLRAGAPTHALAGLDAITARLGLPLQVAVAGRVKAGKSTFVNALLGQRVARTDARECTKVITRFQFGTAERVRVHDSHGGARLMRLDDDGLVPEHFGAPLAQVTMVDVELPLERLRHLTVIDTPGLSSPDAATSERSSDALGLDAASDRAVATAEGVLFVLNNALHGSDKEALSGFQRLARSASNDAVSAIAILNKADLINAPDPMAEGDRLARDLLGDLRSEVADVIAYSGLFAEAANCGRLTERDALALETLTGLPSDQRDLLLLSEASFCESEIGDVDVAPQDRRRLWLLLLEHGVRSCLDAIDAGASGASALRAHLADHSRHPTLLRQFVDLFEANAAALKANAALDELELLTWRFGGEWGARARDELEQLRLDPRMHQLSEVAARRRVRQGEVTLPDDLAIDLEQLVSTPLPQRHPDGDALRQWKLFCFNDATPSQAQVARVLIRSHELAGRGATEASR